MFNAGWPRLFFQGHDVGVREQWKDEIEEELSLHIELRKRRNMEAGMSPEEAMLEADQCLGDHQLLVKRCLAARESPIRQVVRTFAAAATLLLMVGVFWSVFPASAGEYPKLSPFTSVRLEDSAVLVMVDGTRYKLEAINGIAVENILDASRDYYNDLWQRRFAEDLVEVLTRMGHKPATSVRLTVRDLKTDERREFDDVPMSEEKRAAVIRDRRILTASEYPKLSPFTSVELTDAAPLVTVAGKRYELMAINDLPIDRLLDFSRRMYDDDWDHRFTEDLVAVMTQMGHPPEETVKLALRDAETSKGIVLENVAMTEQNRRAVWKDRQKYELTPFTDIRFEGDNRKTFVEFIDAWYQLVSVEGLPVERIVKFCEEHHGDVWQRRMSLELSGVLWRMGHPPGETVKLVVREPHSGAVRRITSAPLTAENAWAVWAAQNARRKRMKEQGSTSD